MSADRRKSTPEPDSALEATVAPSEPVSGVEATVAPSEPVSGVEATVAPSEPVSGVEATVATPPVARGPVLGDEATLAAAGPEGTAGGSGAWGDGEDATLAAPGPGAASGARGAPLTRTPGDDAEDLGDLVTVSRAHYTRGLEFARGGMGRVVAARDRRLGRPVAVKELLVARPDLRRRFEREARITGRLQHPSIVPIYEYGRWPSGEPFYAMKHIKGRPLSELVAEASTLADRLALLPQVTAVAEAVAYAHSERVIHRDLKPSNVLVGDFGETVVIDWGLAKELDRPDDEVDAGEGEDDGADPGTGAGEGAVAADDGLTVAGSVMGTPAFMPPEQARGEAVDERADVYALGAILYTCLSGAAPYRGKTSDQVLAALVEGPPPPLRTVAPDLPPDLLSLVDKAMAPEPGARYPTAEALAADLRRYQRGQLVGAHRYGGAALFRRWVRKNRLAVSITAGFLAALVVLGGISLRRIVQERDRAEAQRQRAEVASAEARRRAREARDNAQAATARLATFYADEGRRELLAGHPQRALAYLAEARRLGHRSLPARILLGTAARQVSPQRDAVEAHGAPVEAVAWAADGRSFYSAGQDRQLRRWSVPGLRLMQTRAFGGFPLRFGPDGSRLLVGQRDHPSLALLEVATGTQRCALEGEGRGALLRVAWSRDGRRVAGRAPGGRVVVWDLPTCAVAGRLAVVAPGGKDDPYELTYLLPGALDAGGQRVAIANARFLVELREVATGRVLWTTAAPHPKRLTAVAFAPDGATLVTGSEDGALRIWDAATGALRKAPAPHGRGVTAVAYSPDGARFATAGLEGTVRLYDAISLQRLATLTGHTNAVKGLRWSAEGAQILTIGDDHTLRLWDGRQGAFRATFRGHVDHITDAAFDPSGRQVASVGHDNRARLWDATLPAARHPVGRDVALAVIDPAGKQLLLASRRGALQLFAAVGGAAPVPLGGEGAAVVAAAFDGPGRRVAVARADHQVEVWDLARRAVSLRLKGHRERITTVGFDPRGRWVASASWDETARLWDARTGALHRVLGGHQGEVGAVLFDPAGRRCATVSADGLVRIWDPRTGTLRSTVGVTGAKQLGASFSRDGRRLVTVSEALRLLTWDAQQGTMLGSVEGQGRDFSRALFAAGGALLVTSSRARADLWDAQSGRLLLSLPEGGEASVSADGGRVVTVDRTLRVATVRSIPTRRLSDAALTALVGRVPWRVRQRRLVREAEAPDWVRFPARPAPLPGAPLVDDVALGLRVEARPGWVVTPTAGGYYLERRVGRRIRLEVQVARGQPLQAADLARLPEIIRTRELRLRYAVASRWGTFAGWPGLTLRGPQWTNQASFRWVAVLPGARPFVFALTVEGASWESPEVRALLAELEGAVRFRPPWVDTPASRRAGLPFVVGGLRVHLGPGWRLATRGPGGALDFAGPEGVKAGLRVLGAVGEGAVWCERGRRYPAPEATPLAGVPARRYRCPEDDKDQVFFVINRGRHMLYLGLTDAKTAASSGPVTAFPGFLRFAPFPPGR